MERHTTEIDNMIRRGTPFTEIEEHIDNLPVDEDVQAALWLYAVCEQDRPVQRAVARGTLALISG